MRKKLKNWRKIWRKMRMNWKPNSSNLMKLRLMPKTLRKKLSKTIIPSMTWRKNLMRLILILTIWSKILEILKMRGMNGKKRPLPRVMSKMTWLQSSFKKNQTWKINTTKKEPNWRIRSEISRSRLLNLKIEEFYSWLNWRDSKTLLVNCLKKAIIGGINVKKGKFPLSKLLISKKKTRINSQNSWRMPRKILSKKEKILRNKRRSWMTRLLDMKMK